MGKHTRKQVPIHTPGKVRYFTYYLIFPHDNDVWVDQTEFVHDLVWELSQTHFRHMPEICRELLTKGEIKMKTPDGVTHRLVIEDVKRPRKWGLETKQYNQALTKPV